METFSCLEAFYKGRHGGEKNLRDLLKVTQLVNDTVVIETQVCVTQKGLKT